MGTISNARASIGLQASGTPTGTNVTGAVNIGQPQITLPFDDADIAYSFKVEATGAGDVARLDIDSGVVSQTTGTPTITDGDGNDFEGDSLLTLVSLYAVHVKAGASNDADEEAFVACFPDFDSTYAFSCKLKPGGSAFCQYERVNDIITTLATSGDSVTITVIGKSS